MDDDTNVFAVLDLENLLHPVRYERAQTLTAAFSYVLAAMRRLGRVRAVGCCDFALTSALVQAAAAAQVRLFPGPAGRDRADGELIWRLVHQRPASADLVVIGSGDAIFAPLAGDLRASGLEVVVVARPGAISHELYREASRFVPLSRLATYGSDRTVAVPDELAAAR